MARSLQILSVSPYGKKLDKRIGGRRLRRIFFHEKDINRRRR
jgi:hypothetical protein